MEMKFAQESQEGKTEEGRLVDFASGIISKQEHRIYYDLHERL